MVKSTAGRTTASEPRKRKKRFVHEIEAGISGVYQYVTVVVPLELLNMSKAVKIFPRFLIGSNYPTIILEALKT